MEKQKPLSERVNNQGVMSVMEIVTDEIKDRLISSGHYTSLKSQAMCGGCDSYFELKKIVPIEDPNIFRRIFHSTQAESRILEVHQSHYFGKIKISVLEPGKGEIVYKVCDEIANEASLNFLEVDSFCPSADRKNDKNQSRPA